MFGKFYSCLDVKWTFLACLLLFEIGSLICGIAPNSTALIIGVSNRSPKVMALFTYTNLGFIREPLQAWVPLAYSLAQW